MSIAFDPRKQFEFTAEGGTVLICRYMSCGQWMCLRDSQKSLMKLADVCEYSDELAKLLTDPSLGPVIRVVKAFDLDGVPIDVSISPRLALLRSFTPAGLNNLAAMITNKAELSELDAKKSASQQASDQGRSDAAAGDAHQAQAMNQSPRGSTSHAPGAVVTDALPSIPGAA